MIMIVLKYVWVLIHDLLTFQICKNLHSKVLKDISILAYNNVTLKYK